MAATSDSAIDWAASRGFSILMDPHATHAELAQKRRHYGERMAAAGFSAEGRDIPMARLIAIADTTARAEEIAARGAAWMVRSYVGPQHGAVRNQQSEVRTAADPVARYVADVIIHGTWQSVLEQILSLRETAKLNYLLCAPLSRESFALLTDRVLPGLS
jgi:alkanesulfonate monooxygenase SsuD/methylene tetrahydromethanopterin reductase-like flavin-dependent oxidoreductase (luciferase family)